MANSLTSIIFFTFRGLHGHRKFANLVSNIILSLSVQNTVDLCEFWKIFWIFIHSFFSFSVSLLVTFLQKFLELSSLMWVSPFFYFYLFSLSLSLSLSLSPFFFYVMVCLTIFFNLTLFLKTNLFQNARPKMIYWEGWEINRKFVTVLLHYSLRTQFNSKFVRNSLMKQ